MDLELSSMAQSMDWELSHRLDQDIIHILHD